MKTLLQVTTSLVLFMTLLASGAAQAQTDTATGGGALGMDYSLSNSNTADGYYALGYNTYGYQNAAVGCNSLFANTTGSENCALGSFSLDSNTTGDANSAVGYQALYANTTGTENSAFGASALLSNTTGNYDVATGCDALFHNSTGNDNTGNGFETQFENTTGFDNSSNGYQSLYNNTTGSQNTADGYYAMLSNTTGGDNTADGSQALKGVTTGSSNIGVGYLAGLNVTTGSSNIEIGNVGVGGDTATIRIGKQGTQTRTFLAGIFGSTAASGVPVYVASNGQLGTLTSSAKFKQNIHDMGSVSDALMSLRPVTFQYKTDIDPTGTPQFGLIAEEVEKVDPQLVVHDADHQIYTVRYEAVNAMLLNEVQKEHATLAAQEKTIAQQQEFADKQAHINAEQQKLIQSLAARLDQLELAKTR